MEYATSVVSAPLTMDETARRAGSWAWAERYLYEVIGGWVPSTGSAAVKVYFDSASQHHVWRAQLWRERLPARLVGRTTGAGSTTGAGRIPGAGRSTSAGPGEPYGDLVRPPSAAAETALKALTNLEGDAGRLGAYCRVVLARTAVAYREWARRCSPASDRPVARVLGMVHADVISDWQDGCGLLVDVLGGPGGEQAVVEAARAAGDIERFWLGEGRLLGGGRAPGA